MCVYGVGVLIPDVGDSGFDCLSCLGFPSGGMPSSKCTLSAQPGGPRCHDPCTRNACLYVRTALRVVAIAGSEERVDTSIHISRAPGMFTHTADHMRHIMIVPDPAPRLHISLDRPRPSYQKSFLYPCCEASG